VRDIELVLREEAGTWGAWSPTVEGLFVSADSAHECVQRAKKAADAELGEFVTVLGHHERVLDGLVLRVAGQRGDFGQRVGVAQRIEDLIRYDRAQIDDDGLTRNAASEAVFVCALPGDTVGWLVAQMDRRGDGLMVATLLDHAGAPSTEPGAFIWSAGILVGPDLPGPTLEESGMTLDTTVGEYLHAMVRGMAGQDLEPPQYIAGRAHALV
jgi:hypothetical protein